MINNLNLFQIGKNNWIYYDFYITKKNTWKVSFFKSVHGTNIKKHDGLFWALEGIETSNKQELQDILNQTIYQIEHGII